MTSPETEPDFYALDDTLVGRLVQAGLVGAYVAVPDYIPEGGGKRTWTRVGLVSVLVAAAAVANSWVEEPDEDEAARVMEDMKDVSVPKTLAIGGAALGAGILAEFGAAKLAKNLARRLRKRGFKQPYTLFGVLAGGVVFAQSVLESRSKSARSTHV